MIEITNLTVKANPELTTATINNFSLTGEAGQCIGIQGRSGVGKSTLLKAIMRLLPIESGTIKIANLDHTSDTQDWLRSVQLVFQDPYSSLHPRLTVEECLAVPLHSFKITSSRQEIIDILKKVRLDNAVLNRYHYKYN